MECNAPFESRWCSASRARFKFDRWKNWCTVHGTPPLDNIEIIVSASEGKIYHSVIEKAPRTWYNVNATEHYLTTVKGGSFMGNHITKRLGLQVSDITRAKRQSGKLAYLLYLQGIDKNTEHMFVIADRVRSCSTYWSGFKCPQCGRLHGMITYGCKHRLCPICATRKSRATAAQAMQVIEALQRQEKPGDWEYCLLTLTQRNVSGENLSREIDALLDAWSRLRYLRVIRSDLLGWARTVEITAGANDTYHPHIHCILIIRRGSQLRLTSYWRRLWSKMMGLDYEPICDCRGITDAAAVFEVSKYVTKVGKLLSNPDLGQCYDDVRYIGDAISGRRLRSYGGVWAKMRREMKMVDVESMDDGALDAAGALLDGHGQCECGSAVEAVCLMWSGMEYTEVSV